ncbi:MAG: [FeFe] hydrogenase H-cluster radical SAM maturase HydE [Clostridiales bacterium]|nr:[FeFe] hydrogenase H-cluster radical SAM maturase HydE [Clostridiales bacterium]
MERSWISIDKTNKIRIDILNETKQLSFEDWNHLLSTWTEHDFDYSCSLARSSALNTFGNKVFFRGIIEFTNICKNDCLYCGIRKSNNNVVRYRLSKEEIMICCAEGYELGYRTFVLQGGEDPYYNDDVMEDIVMEIRRTHPDCAITLSLGERSKDSYQRLYDAGADRYLLRHETADSCHYSQLHPKEMSLETRLNCLNDLKEIGYQTGCGMMVGSPFQTTELLAKDMMFLSKFKPHMVGMGPFIPHGATPFKNHPAGSPELTLFLLSLVRIMLPDVLLPATTALGSLQDNGRLRGLLAGCNVIMPNLSPMSIRKKYLLYDNKAGVDTDARESLRMLKEQVKEIGYEMSSERGDYKERY